MKYGFRTRMQGAAASSDELVTLVQRAEQLGYASVAIADHIIVPRTIASTYPYSPTGEFLQARRHLVSGAVDPRCLPRSVYVNDQAGHVGDDRAAASPLGRRQDAGDH